MVAGPPCCCAGRFRPMSGGRVRPGPAWSGARGRTVGFSEKLESKEPGPVRVRNGQGQSNHGIFRKDIFAEGGPPGQWWHRPGMEKGAVSGSGHVLFHFDFEG